MSKLFPVLRLFTHLSMLFFSLHNLFPPPSSSFISCFTAVLIEVKFHHVYAKWWESGSVWGLYPLPPPASCLPCHQAQHIFILSSVPQHVLVALLLLRGEYACLKTSPASNVPSDTKQTPNTIVMSSKWAPAGHRRPERVSPQYFIEVIHVQRSRAEATHLCAGLWEFNKWHKWEVRGQPESRTFAGVAVTRPLVTAVKEPWVFIWIASFLRRRLLGTGLSLSVFTEKGIISFQMGGHIIGCS